VYDVAYAASSTAGKGYFQNSSSSIQNFVPNREGGNGLDYVTAHDPRLPLDSLRVAADGEPFMVPRRYNAATHTVVLASGIEARLIEAEALLAANDVEGWADKLNDLRANAITPAIPDLTADSTTTATPELRLRVLFRERAFWLFGTGHRQGDLRRMVRQYDLRQDEVYPVGPYYLPGVRYGTDVTVPIPPQEREGNPYYNGCLNRDA
jgi:hypothetical protein